MNVNVNVGCSAALPESRSTSGYGGQLLASARPSTTMPISYRKFDAIVDSSDDEEQQPAVKRAPQPARPPSPAAHGPLATSITGATTMPAQVAASAPLGPPTLPVAPGGTTFSGHLPVPADPNGRAAVCSTMKDVRGRIDSWVRWHLWLGFARLYIFFDDSTETASIEAAKAAGGYSSAVVPLLRGSEALRAAWARQPSWASMGVDADRDVQIRQLLNAQLAMELARADGLTWLLHLDSDELFLPSLGASPPSARPASPEEWPCSRGAAVAHFAALAAAGCECFVYHNYEGVPTHVDEPRAAAAAAAPAPPGGPASDPFVSLEVFKQCESKIEWRAAPEAARAIEQWRQRSRAGKLFLYYENGKCACRVDTDGLWVPVPSHRCLPTSAFPPLPTSTFPPLSSPP